MRELFREGVRLGEALAKRAAAPGEEPGTLPFRAGGGDRPVRVLVLGAGYAGLTCFFELQDHLSRQYEVVLVNSDKYHWFTTELHTYVAGTAEDAVRVPLRRLVRPPGRLVVGRVAGLHPQAQQVQLEGGERLHYDLLVFALGSDPEYYGLPGVAEHSLIVGTWQGATELKQRVEALLMAGEVQAPGGSPAPGVATALPPQVVIAGGGLTGVEVAGELADEHGERLALTILEAGPAIMAGFDPDLVTVAAHVLEAKGVRILTGNPITRVDARAIHLKGGEALPYDLLVWSGGVRGSAILEGSGLDLTPRGRGRVDPYLRSVSDERIYLIGDSAAFTDTATGREVPPTAQAAVQMGRVAGQNIRRRLRGQPEQPFTFRQKGAFASLGRGQGVGQIGRERFAGLPAMMVKHLIEGHHAWEMGSGLMPLVRKLVLAPGQFLAARRALRPAVRPLTREGSSD